MPANFDLPDPTGLPGNVDSGSSRPWLPPIFRDAVKYEPRSPRLLEGPQIPAAALPSGTNLLPLSNQSSHLGYVGSSGFNKLPAASGSSPSAAQKRSEQFPGVLPSLPGTVLKSMGTIIAAQGPIPPCPLPLESSSSMQRIGGPEDWIDMMYDTPSYNRERLPDAEDPPDPKATPCTVLLQMPQPKSRVNAGSSSAQVNRSNSKRQLSPISQSAAGAAGKPGIGRRSKARVSELPGPRGSGLQHRQPPKSLSAKSLKSRSASASNGGGSDPKPASSSVSPEPEATAAKATYRKKRVDSSTNPGIDKARATVPHLPPLKAAGSRI